MTPSPQRPVLTGSARSGWLRFRTSARTDRRPGRGSAVSRVLVVAMVVISCVLALGASPVMAQPGSAPAATPTNGTDATGDQTGDQPGDQPGDQSDPGDVADLRTRFSQSFLQASGQVEQEISEQPVNYRDEEGAWQPIDSSLVPSDRPGYAVENAANDFDVFIPSDVDAKPVRVQDDSGWVTFNPTAATGAPDVDDSSATFDATATNTGFDYEVEPTGLKESIQLAAAPSAAPVFHYALQMATGLTPHLDGSGAVIVSAAVGPSIARHL